MSRAWTSSTLMSLKKYFSIIISCRAVYGLKITKIKPKDLPSSSALLFFHVRETNICGLCISPMHIRKRCANTKEKSWEVFEWMSNAGNSQCSCPIELNSALCLFNFFKNSTGIRWWSRRVKKCVSKSGSGSNSNRNSEWKNQRHTPRDCIRRKEEEEFVTC